MSNNNNTLASTADAVLDAAMVKVFGENGEHLPTVVPPSEGPVFTAEELAAIDTIAAGGTVDGIDVLKLDAAILTGIASGAGAAEKGLRDMAGYMGAALKLRTWTRVTDPATMTLFASEAAFVDWTLSKTPLLATVARRELLAVIDGITDENGKPLSVRRMAALLGISKSVVAEDRAAIAGGEDTGEDTGEDRGPQTGGQTVSDPKAVKRHVTGFASAGTRVRDDLQQMTPDQILSVAEEARDTLSAIIAFATLQGVELPEWAAGFAKSNAALQGTAKPKLRSGAEGTVATGPALKGAPVDPTAAPVTPGEAAARRAGKRQTA
jgi:hypothetical protein